MDIQVFITTKDGLLTITSPHTGVISRQYDNNAQRFVFERPSEYQDHDLVLVFIGGQKQLGEVNIGMENNWPIEDSITRAGSLTLFVRFIDGTSFRETANGLRWTIESAPPSTGDTPESLPNEFIKLRSQAVAGIQVVDTTLFAYNIDGDEVDNTILPSSGETIPGDITTDDVTDIDRETKLTDIINELTAKDNILEEDIDKKVDKEDGKQLSQNNYSNEDKEIVDGFDAFYELVTEKFSIIDGALSQDEQIRVDTLKGNPATVWGLPGNKTNWFYKIYGDSTATGLPSWWVTGGETFQWAGLFEYLTYGNDNSSRMGTVYLFKVGTNTSPSDIAVSDWIGSSIRWSDWDGIPKYSYVDGEIEKVRELISKSGVLSVNGKEADENSNVNIGPNDMDMEGIPYIGSPADINESDSVLLAIAKTMATAKASLYSATAEKNGSLITIKSENPIVDMTRRYAVVFNAPSDFSSEDTYYINGATIQIVDENKRDLVNAWTQGVPVGIVIVGGYGYFVGNHLGSNPFSTQTRAVDVWYDGRIIYETMIEVESLEYDPATPIGSIEVPFTANDLDFIISVDAIANQTVETKPNRQHLPLPWIDVKNGEASYMNYIIYDDAIMLEMKGSPDYDWSTYNVRFIIRYVGE